MKDPTSQKNMALPANRGRGSPHFHGDVANNTFRDEPSVGVLK
jgi:hypothetical protein